MRPNRKIRFIQPHGRPGRPFNAWIRRWPLLGSITLATILDRLGYGVAVYNESISGSVLGPQHTERTAGRIVRFARRSRLETMQISVLTPFPGTPLMAEFRPHLALDRFPGNWDYYDGTHCVFRHGQLGVERLQRVLLDAHRRFYRWGGWSLRRLRAVVNERMGLTDKLALVWANARTARATLRAWKEETAAFLDTVRARAAGGATA